VSEKRASRVLTIILIVLILSEFCNGILVKTSTMKNIFISLIVLEGKPIMVIQTSKADFLNITLEDVNRNRITLPTISLNESNVLTYTYDGYLVIEMRAQGSLTVYVIDSSLTLISNIKLNYNYSVQYPLLTGDYIVLISKKLVGVISRNMTTNGSLLEENIPIYNISISATNFLNKYEKNISISDVIGYPLNLTLIKDHIITGSFFPLNEVLPIFTYKNWIYIVYPIYSNSTIGEYEIEAVNLNTGSISSTEIKFRGYEWIYSF